MAEEIKFVTRDFIPLAGLIIGMVGYVWYFKLAFRKNIPLAIVSFCILPVFLLFLMAYWQEFKRPFFILIIGIVLIVAGLAL